MNQGFKGLLQRCSSFFNPAMHSLVLQPQWKRVKACGKFILLTAILASTAVTAHSPPPDGRACTTARVDMLKKQLYKKNGALRDLVFAQEAFDWAMCAQEGKRLGKALDVILFREFELRKCITEKTVGADCSYVRSGGGHDTYKPPAHIEPVCDDRNVCHIDYFVRLPKGKLASALDKPFGKSGGLPFSYWLGHTGAKGHYEITQSALQALILPQGRKVGVGTIEIMADASRDADFYEWKVPAAHAQAANDTAGLLTEDEAKAFDNFKAWNAQKMAGVAAKCLSARSQPDDYRKAAYLLGYLLHGIQDFVFHEGMSNAEHSWRDNVAKKRVDSEWRYEEKFALARFATTRYLTAFTSHLAEQGLATCLDSIYALPEPAEFFYPEKHTLLGKGMDISLAEIRYFSKLGEQVEKSHLSSEHGAGEAEKVKLRNKWLKWDDVGVNAQMMQVAIEQHIVQLFVP